MRFIFALACFIVAIDCFDRNGGELGLPYWLWVAVGVSWLIHMVAAFFWRPQP